MPWGPQPTVAQCPAQAGTQPGGSPGASAYLEPSGAASHRTGETEAARPVQGCLWEGSTPAPHPSTLHAPHPLPLRAVSLSQSPTDSGLGAGQRAGSCGDPAGCQGWRLGVPELEGQVPGAGCRRQRRCAGRCGAGGCGTVMRRDAGLAAR